MKLFILSLLFLYSINGLAKLEKIKVGNTVLSVEVARTKKEQQRGLMFRKALDENKGMLFIFDKEEPRSFWMKNTFIPLSIGYFSAEKKLLEVIDMKPVVSEMQLDTPSYPSRFPAKYALEVNKGWFQRNKVPIGAMLVLKP